MKLAHIFAMVVVLTCFTACSSKVTFGINWGRVDETREGIHQVIEEPDRRAEMQAVVDAYAAEAKEIMAEIKANREEIVEKNRDYDITREELQVLYDRISRKLDQLIELARDRSMEMRQLCSEGEWNEIFKHSDNLMNFEF